MYYSRSENKNGQKEALTDHLELTSYLAGEFARIFEEQSAGAWCGLYHDAGKASKLFQDVLEGREHGVNHEAAGAYITEVGIKLQLLAVVIYAHHEGLKWHIKDELNQSFIKENSTEFRPKGRRFSVSGKSQYQEVLRFYKEEVKPFPVFPFLKKNCESYYHFLPQMLHARMLLSCLCDADYLASGSHHDKSLLQQANEVLPGFEQMKKNLEQYRENIKTSSTSDPSVNKIRDIVYGDCVDAALTGTGLFTLTAPTGTGKTLALLAFALNHAIYNNQKSPKFRRIIVILPFLSIIRQSVNIYRKICDDVLEADSTTKCTETTKLMSERWSAPFIVTTSVKFFEALFQSKPTDLRFLHSIAGSIVIFDEAQNIPVHLMGTTIESIKVLCEMFGCTVVFSTATQPDYSVRQDIAVQHTEIIKEPQKLYNQTRRVTVKWNIKEKIPFSVVAEQMSGLSSVCCVVNKRNHAYKLFSELKEVCNPGECFYITTDLCKAHRDRVIEEITQRLKDGKICRVVSTSCIEAGIDLDFAYMFRALAPLDSIIQCAGRCNRNGKNAGIMIVFIPDEEKLYPSKDYEIRSMCVRTLVDRHEIDINSLEHISEYYTEVFMKFKENKALEKAIADLDFDRVEKEYKIITNTGANVLVPYKEQIEFYEELRQEAVTKGISKSWMRRAAMITVTNYQVDKLNDICEKAFVRLADGKVQQMENWYILNDSQFYRDDIGLHFDDDSRLDYCL